MPPVRFFIPTMPLLRGLRNFFFWAFPKQVTPIFRAIDNNVVSIITGAVNYRRYDSICRQISLRISAGPVS